LLPVNFVTMFTGCGVDEEEVVGTGQFQGCLVWHSGKGSSPKRPTADRLSYGQFFEANARILNLLNLDEDGYIQYLDYLRQLRILLQTFTVSSVFSLDHIHRQYIHETGNVWNVIENTLQTSVLKKKDDGNRGHSGANVQPSRHGDRDASSRGGAVHPAKSTNPADYGDKVCWLYNLFKGCHWGDACYYPHVCSVDNCRGNHPTYKHGSQPGHSAAVDKSPKSSS
jgi:hypothetical protein